MTTDKKPLRSVRSYGPKDKDGFIHRSWMKSQGFPADVFDGRPVIGICNTWSELTPCNSGLRDVAEQVKKGVWEAGGLPLEFPAMSLGETQMRPTAMLFRNLLAMEVEESIRGNPIDAVVLLGGCDKTTQPKYSRGYYRLYVEHVMQADRGCDLDFLIGSSGSTVDRESH